MLRNVTDEVLRLVPSPVASETGFPTSTIPCNSMADRRKRSFGSLRCVNFVLTVC